ncbi:hypothetical protein [Spiroplasma diminutum]|uniref:Transmembrane protein n=1 Tax=Spiroplasma diminutum CUAS-1 TaxID=1276221 RepID=S5LZ09_9MOLU|nr:hypothetical protein [Spiroplasma diminutum]AGR41786.1 hypothetical protein SDIMI_v3c00820 [Spiroplasma diminutum CUAS-1]
MDKRAKTLGVAGAITSLIIDSLALLITFLVISLLKKYALEEVKEIGPFYNVFLIIIAIIFGISTIINIFILIMLFKKNLKNPYLLGIFQIIIGSIKILVGFSNFIGLIGGGLTLASGIIIMSEKDKDKENKKTDERDLRDPNIKPQ